MEIASIHLSVISSVTIPFKPGLRFSLDDKNGRVVHKDRLSQSRLNPVSDFHNLSNLPIFWVKKNVTIPFKPGLRFSRLDCSGCCWFKRRLVTIPFKPGLRFSHDILPHLGDLPVVVTIPFKPGLRFSRLHPIPKHNWEQRSQSRLNPVSDFHSFWKLRNI